MHVLYFSWKPGQSWNSTSCGQRPTWHSCQTVTNWLAHAECSTVSTAEVTNLMCAGSRLSVKFSFWICTYVLQLIPVVHLLGSGCICPCIHVLWQLQHGSSSHCVCVRASNSMLQMLCLVAAITDMEHANSSLKTCSEVSLNTLTHSRDNIKEYDCMFFGFGNIQCRGVISVFFMLSQTMCESL